MNPSLPTPLDVKIMNQAATALFLILAVLLVAAAMFWAVRRPIFSLAGIDVMGDISHTNEVTLRANVAPQLRGNFFTLNLRQTKQAFEAVPWVRNAVVQREFPNRLRVTLHEHQPVAYWGDAGDSTLVNSFGEVFEANEDEVGDVELPRLKGPQGQSAQVLDMFNHIKPALDPLGDELGELELTPRGSWRAQLDDGTLLELGSGNTDELLVRLQRFVRTLTQVTAKYGRQVDALEYADLRYESGYALRLRGVATTVQAPKVIQ